jgi:hypothetical protein
MRNIVCSIISFVSIVLSFSVNGQSATAYSQAGSTDTIFIENRFSKEILQLAFSPKVVVIRNVPEITSWRKIVKQLNTFDPVPEVILDENDLSELPAVFSKLKTPKLSLRKEFSINQNQAVNVMLEMPNLKVVSLEIEEFEGISAETKPYCSLDSIYIFNQSEAGLEHRMNMLHIACLDEKGKPRSIPVMYSEWYTPDIEEDDGLSFTPLEEETTSTAFAKSYLSFAPPIPRLDVPRTTISVPANQSRDFTYAASGTKIGIPANAFVDAQGNAVQGNVDIQYREFRNPLDCMLSGIPMGDNTGSDPWYFESGGMMELTASLNGTEVFLAPNKPVSVNFVTTSDSLNYDLWAYNDASSNWIKAPEASRTKAQDIPKSVLVYENSFRSFQGFPDKLTFEERWVNENYFNIQHRNSFKGTPNYISLVNMKRNKRVGVTFMISNVSMANPELASVKNARFAVDTKMTTRQFRKAYGPKAIKINDIRLNGEGSDVDITLKTDQEFITLHTKSVAAYKRKHKTIFKEKELNFKRYNKALSKREKNFNRLVKRNAKRVSYMPITEQDRHEYAYNQAVSCMSDKEKQMSEKRWKSYSDSLYNIYIMNLTAVNTQGLVKYQFNIYSTGVYNTDIKKEYPQNENVIAKYEEGEKKEVNPSNVYVFSRRGNSCLRFDASGSYNVNRLFVDRDKPYALLAMENETRAWISAADDSNSKDYTDRNRTFHLRPIDISSMDRKQLYTALGYRLKE